MYENNTKTVDSKRVPPKCLNEASTPITMQVISAAINPSHVLPEDTNGIYLYLPCKLTVKYAKESAPHISKKNHISQATYAVTEQVTELQHCSL